ncbi:MAG TPA: condensation domain-containing protein [Clostridia bacterium]|nr:condensation domain-containing protein [Clostridia bacterium]
MEIKIKFDDTTLKKMYGDFFKKANSSGNPFEVISRLNMDLYNKFYDNMPQSMLGYYKLFSEMLEKYLDIIKPGIGKIPDSPDVLPANGHDIYNYVARYGSGNFHCQAIVKLDGKLDFEKLTKAVRLSFDAEPVLGSRFVEGNPPYWKRMENIDKVKFCTFEEADDIDAAVQRFMESPLDMDKDAKIKVRLIRSEPYDTVAIKANHACCDGTGIKEYVQLLSDIYSKILSEDRFIPIPSKRGRSDQDRLFKSLGIADPDALWIPGSDVTIPTWAFPWIQGTSNVTRIVTCRLLPDQMDMIASFAKSRKVTINDLIITAYCRAMLGMGQPVYGVPMGINVTVDLRRYLPDKKTEAIRNLSGSSNIWLSMVENEAFGDTLSRVAFMTDEMKKGYPGLQSAIGLERLEKIRFKETLGYYQATSKVGKNLPDCPAFYGNRCVPALSNLGIISKEIIKFGTVSAVDYYIIPPVVSAPGILLVAGTYNGVMTMGAGFFENTVPYDDMKKLINNIKDELLKGCVL